MTSEIEQQNTDVQKESSSLTSCVLERIEKERVSPVPKWQFLLTEYGIWVLWGLSVLIGAIAFSVMIFFFLHSGFSFYEATHENAFDFFMEVLPFLWIGVFVLMALLAHYNLRHTKCGYRYTVLRVLVSSIVFSFIGGLLLHTLGMGFLVDNFISKQVPAFPTLERIEAKMWQHPQQGRMIGAYTGAGLTPETVMFTDQQGEKWQLNTSELNPFDLQNLYEGKKVHVIGIPSTTTEAYFHGCGVFPWMLDRKVSFSDMREERDEFLKRMRSHQKEMFQELIATGTLSQFKETSLCANHATVMRVKAKFAQ